MNRYLLLVCCCGALAAQVKPQDKYKPGHSHLGEGFDEGPRQKPWAMPGAGSVSFPIQHSNPETQQWFNQGVALLHSFWYYEAERAFRWALKLEPDNAMVWWGLARSQSGGPRTAEFLREAVKRKGTVSERERLFIESDEAAVLPPVGEKPAHDASRMVLERLVMKYPDDVEAKAHLAWQLMTADRMGTELLAREILSKEPNHPGAHHARIHNWDGKDAEFALASCKRYGEVAPSVGHALHMPGHVYAAAGMWHEAAISMDAATRVEKRYMADRQTFPFENWNYPHNKNYLAYIQAQLGMEKAALSAGRQLMAAPRMMKTNPRSDQFPQQMEAQIILARTYARFGRWTELLKAKQFDWDDKYLGNKVQKAHLEALAHIGLGEQAKATARLAKLEELKDEVEKSNDYFLKSWFPVMVREVKGKLMLASGRDLDGLAELGAAAREWEAMFKDQNDPPFYPTNLLDDLGRAYLTAKSPALAGQAYARSLELVRNNAWALEGLAESYLAQGDKERATGYYARLMHVWSDADSPMSEAVKLGLKAEPVDASPGPQRNYAKTTLKSFGPDVWEPFPASGLSAVDPQKKRVRLAEYKGRNVVLIFYLGRECAHCMDQLRKAAELKDDFEKNNAVVLAISPNKPEDNADALKLKPLPFRLLSDEKSETAKRFLAYDDFERLELHATVWIDPEGHVRWAHRGGDPYSDFERLFQEMDRLNRAE